MGATPVPIFWGVAVNSQRDRLTFPVAAGSEHGSGDWANCVHARILGGNVVSNDIVD